MSPYRTPSNRQLMYSIKNCDYLVSIKLTDGSEVISTNDAYLCSTHFQFFPSKTTTKNSPYIRSVPIQPYPVWLVLLFGGRFPGCTGLPVKNLGPCACFFQIGSFPYNADVLCVVAKSVIGIPKLFSSICTHTVDKAITCLAS